MVVLTNIILNYLATNLTKQISRKLLSMLVIGIQIMSVIIGIILYIYIKRNSVLEIKYEWLENINISFVLDGFTIMFMILITGITMIVMLYSLSYLSGDPYLPKFLGLLGIFCVSMLWLCVSNNLVTLFIGWEGVGLASFLLISFWASRNEANVSALKAVFLNRIGDVFLLFAIILTIISVKTGDIYLLNNVIQETALNNKSILSYGSVVVIFFCLAACAKSAQLFLHTWLPDAMEGPTPVSSLLHSATMVTAGVFLIMKLYILMSTSTEICYIFALLGVLTAIISAIFGVFQYDIKKIIAYSTCSQLGLLYFTAILGTLFAASYHLITHAFFKCLLFLCSGVIIHANADEQDIRKMGLFSKILPVVYLIFTIGTFSLIGFIFMSGYYSKEFLLETLYSSGLFGSFLFIFATFGVFFSAFYSGRLLFLTFIKPSSFTKFSIFFEGDFRMYVSLISLTIFSLLAGYLFFDLFTNYFFNDGLLLNQNLSLLDFDFNSSFFLQHLPLLFSFVGFWLGISYLALTRFSYLSNLTFYYFSFSFFCLKNSYDTLYGYFFSRVILFLGRIKYMILDRGFFEVATFIFKPLLTSKSAFTLSFSFLIVVASLWGGVILLNNNFFAIQISFCKGSLFFFFSSLAIRKDLCSKTLTRTPDPDFAELRERHAISVKLLAIIDKQGRQQIFDFERPLIIAMKKIQSLDKELLKSENLLYTRQWASYFDRALQYALQDHLALRYKQRVRRYCEELTDAYCTNFLVKLYQLTGLSIQLRSRRLTQLDVFCTHFVVMYNRCINYLVDFDPDRQNIKGYLLGVLLEISRIDTELFVFSNKDPKPAFPFGAEFEVLGYTPLAEDFHAILDYLYSVYTDPDLECRLDPERIKQIKSIESQIPPGHRFPLVVTLLKLRDAGILPLARKRRPLPLGSKRL